MKMGRILCVATVAEWRTWLARHHASRREIWLVYPRQHTGRKRIPYNRAVEEALCYGWIDSTLKSIDADRYAQRFSPRKTGSALSEPNRLRIDRLVAAGRMTRAGLAAVAHAYKPGSAGNTAVPAGILAALKADPRAWKNFQSMPASYRRIRVAFVESRKRHGMVFYRKSLAHLIRMTALNRRFGFIRD